MAIGRGSDFRKKRNFLKPISIPDRGPQTSEIGPGMLFQDTRDPLGVPGSVAGQNQVVPRIFVANSDPQASLEKLSLSGPISIFSKKSKFFKIDFELRFRAPELWHWPRNAFPRHQGPLGGPRKRRGTKSSRPVRFRGQFGPTSVT